MGHAIALDTGSCYQQCGKTGTYALEVYFSSTFWAANFFNILNNNAVSINGLQVVSVNQTSVTYSVTNTSNTTYTWTVPAGASIVSGQGTNQITVNFGTISGNVTVTETSSTCKIGPFNLFVNVGGTTGISQISNLTSQIFIYPNPGKGIINIQSQTTPQEIKIINLLGEVLYSKQPNTNENKIDVNNYSSGIYLIYMKAVGKEATTRKIILE